MEIIMKKNNKYLDDYILNIKELSGEILKQLKDKPIISSIATKDDYLHKQIFEEKVKDFKQKQIKEYSNLTEEVRDFIENIKAHI